MSDGTVLYVCELCGGSVDVDDAPEGVHFDDPVYACGTCLPILALPLTLAQRQQVVEWVWGNLALRQAARRAAANDGP